MSIIVEPRDEHNELLLSRVHPSDYENPRPDNPYNLVVVGAGTAGLVSAAGAAGLGARVALVERALTGGDCLNYGCVPSKGIISAATAAANVRGAGAFGVRVGGEVTMDFSEAMARMRRLRAQISEVDSVQRFTDLGVDVFIGQGTFTGLRTLEVDGKDLQFSKAVIATGARAAGLPIPGLEEAGYLTNETIFNLTELPGRLAVIGAGPIGCEMSQVFQRFGSDVSLLELAPHVLIREDADAAEIIQDALLRDGVNVVTKIEKIERVSGGVEGRSVHYTQGGEERRLDVDAVLVAVGRAPNVDGLGLEEARIEYHKRGVTVDDTYRTTNPRIYAAGDICSPYQFTHAADFMARTVLNNALFPGRKKKGSALTIPWCTYTDPQIAHVGITEQGAEKESVQIDTFTMRMDDVDRAILDGETEGFVKVHVARGSDKILGATIVARHAGDMIGELVMAMTNDVGLGAVANVIHPYPTQSDAIRRTGDLYNRTRLTPRVSKLLGGWLSWRRGK
jgi:pyruvate/2-oxoglutarate dehydrogenase complex dihydrolipoamide dehydrogenase (E3) component